MRPKYFIPVHGEYRMLYHHRLLAESVGVEPNHTFILSNGDVVDIENQVARHTRKIRAGNTYVDGVGVGDVGDIVLRDRKQLSEDGMLVIVLTMSKVERKLINDPDTISRGFVYVRDSEELLRDVDRLIKKTVNEFQNQNNHHWGALKQDIRKSIGEFLFSKTRRKPMILPIIIEI
jgi:ribonuclease J